MPCSPPRLLDCGVCCYLCYSFLLSIWAAGFIRRDSMGNDSPRFLRRLQQGLLGPLIIVAGLGSYLLVLKWRGPASVAYTQTGWDRLIPFQPARLYLYFAPYAVAPVILGLTRRETFAWYRKRALLDPA